MKTHAVAILVASLAAALLAPLPTAAQRGAQPSAPPTIVLDKGATEFVDPFSQLTQIIELRDKRVLAVDVKEKELRIVDFARGTATAVPRIGSGPLEYQVPGFLLRGAADTTMYYDAVQRRFLFISPTGAPVRTVPYGGTDAATILSQVVPAWADGSGRVYGQGMGMTMPVSGQAAAPTFADSVDIQIVDLRTGGAESLARIRSPMSRSQPKMEMGTQGIKMTMVAPDFRSTDSWAVLPDGRVALLRDGIYRVHFVARGRSEVLGPTVDYAPVPVTAAERRAMVDSVRTAMDRSLKDVRSRAAAVPGRGVPTMEVDVLEPASWPAAKPPYAAILASPDGRLWVATHSTFGTKSARFDVLDGTGALVARVQLALGESFIGFGRGTLYTIRTDSDDLQYLRRYTLPAPIN